MKRLRIETTSIHVPAIVVAIVVDDIEAKAVGGGFRRHETRVVGTKWGSREGLIIASVVISHVKMRLGRKTRG